MKRWTKSLTLAACLGAMVTGCGQPTAPPGEEVSAATPETSSTSAPPIENCGRTVHVESPPQRVVTIKSAPLELLLALGLEDHVTASAFLDGEIPETLSPSGWSPNVISEEVPNRESFLALEPDFVFAGWESNLSTDGIGDRESLAKWNIESYVVPLACTFGSSTDETATFDDVFSFIEETGRLFDAEEEAEALIEEQQGRLTDITHLDDAPSVLWFSSGSDIPFVGGGAGTPQMIMEAAGVTNVAADQPKTWFSMPWESFVAHDPDFIVLVDSPWNTAEQKREQLAAHPVARSMEAVQEERYIEVPFAATEAGIRNVDAAAQIADSIAQHNEDR